VSGFPHTWLKPRMPCNGPALPSSHRTCRFPASGVPRYKHHRLTQGVDGTAITAPDPDRPSADTCWFPPGRGRAVGSAGINAGTLLGLLVQLLPQKRELLRDVGFAQHILDLRSGILTIQAVLPSSCSRMYLAGLLRSTGITPPRRYYEPRRLPTRADRTVMPSRPPLNATWVGAFSRSGLPGS
jgi:hypothetical protein